MSGIPSGHVLQFSIDLTFLGLDQNPFGSLDGQWRIARDDLSGLESIGEAARQERTSWQRTQCVSSRTTPRLATNFVCTLSKYLRENARHPPLYLR